MKKSFFAVLLAVAVICGMWQGAYTFSDVESHWAKDYIEQLVSSGAIKGYADGTFRPDGTITRAEFVAILLRAMGNDVGQPKTGNWYDNYMKEARSKGLVKFAEFEDVNANISRIEITKLIVRALGKEDIAKKLSYTATEFKDDKAISEANKGYVRVAYEYGIINGTPEGKFLPNANATRAEASKIIVTFLENRDKDITISEEQKSEGDLYMYCPPAGKEVKVETSYPELIPHIRKALEICKPVGNEYWDITYWKSNTDNTVQFVMYKDKEEYDKPYGVRHSALGYYLELEKAIYTVPELYTYLPYDISLWDIKNEIAQAKFKEIVKDVFPEAYDLVVKELENTLKDVNYEKMVWEKIGGREIRIHTHKGSKQMEVYVALKNG